MHSRERTRICRKWGRGEVIIFRGREGNKKGSRGRPLRAMMATTGSLRGAGNIIFVSLCVN